RQDRLPALPVAGGPDGRDRAGPVLGARGRPGRGRARRGAGDRLVAIHVKDGIKPETNPFAPGAPKFSSSSLDQRHAGEGEVPTVEAMKAATNVKYAVIEYDNAPGDVFADIENSYR